MTSIRIRDAIVADPPEWTIEWYQAAADAGEWALLRNGEIISFHHWKWQARRAQRRVTA